MQATLNGTITTCRKATLVKSHCFNNTIKPFNIIVWSKMYLVFRLCIKTHTTVFLVYIVVLSCSPQSRWEKGDRCISTKWPCCSKYRSVLFVCVFIHNRVRVMQFSQNPCRLPGNLTLLCLSTLWWLHKKKGNRFASIVPLFGFIN